MKRLRYENGGLDATDVDILKALAANARTTNAELSRTVGLSPPSVAERIKRMEEAGVITGYTVSVDMDALGFPIGAWMRIRPMAGELQRVKNVVQDIPLITECDRITGDDCYIARVNAQSIKALEGVNDRLNANAMTNTSIVQSSPVKRRLPHILVKT